MKNLTRDKTPQANVFQLYVLLFLMISREWRKVGHSQDVKPNRNIQQTDVGVGVGVGIVLVMAMPSVITLVE